ncbi:MAG: head-tail adaptor protein [Rhodobacteraceae bacterium]|nr:head-tail adaptor protein [Paracoccaceae bacterium]MBR9820722.1 head-tail adaptor protein [Paracoccaceae bacterium]
MLREAVAFDRPTRLNRPGGVTEMGWEPVYDCRAEFIYQRGSEAVEAARLQGRGIYKVKIRQSLSAREITTDWRMRDTRRELTFDLVEVDPITDPRWIYIVAEVSR